MANVGYNIVNAPGVSADLNAAAIQAENARALKRQETQQMWKGIFDLMAKVQAKREMAKSQTAMEEKVKEAAKAGQKIKQSYKYNPQTGRYETSYDIEARSDKDVQSEQMKNLLMIMAGLRKPTTEETAPYTPVAAPIAGGGMVGLPGGISIDEEGNLTDTQGNNRGQISKEALAMFAPQPELAENEYFRNVIEPFKANINQSPFKPFIYSSGNVGMQYREPEKTTPEITKSKAVDILTDPMKSEYVKKNAPALYQRLLAFIQETDNQEGKVKVISPDGQEGLIPVDKLSEAMKKGFKRVQ